MSTQPVQEPFLPRAEHAVARSLLEAEAPEAAYPKILSAMGEALGWLSGSVWEIDEDRESMHCAECWLAPGVEAAGFLAQTREIRFARGVGLPGRTWQAGRPVWVRDVTRDDNFPRAAEAAKAGLHAAFCFPVRSARGVLGAVEFFDSELREPDERLLATVENLGAQIGQWMERRRAEQAVRERDQLRRGMLEAALDCVVTMDHRGRVLDFNPAAERTFGYTADEAVGRDMAELIIPPALRPLHRRGLERYLETGEQNVLDHRIEITGMRSDGSEFPVELAITRIDLPGPPRFTGYLRDITDRKRAEAELRASRARIVDAGDAERRKIERDLHDGAQQRLVAIALSLRLARAQVEDGSPVAEMLDEVGEELSSATTSCGSSPGGSIRPSSPRAGWSRR